MLDTKDAQKSNSLNEVNDAFLEVVKAFGDRAMDTAIQKISGATDKLTDIAAGNAEAKPTDESGAGVFQRALTVVRNRGKNAAPGASADDEG